MNQIASYPLEASGKSHTTASSDKDKADSGTSQVATSRALDNRIPILDDAKLEPQVGQHFSLVANLVVAPFFLLSFQSKSQVRLFLFWSRLCKHCIRSALSIHYN